MQIHSSQSSHFNTAQTVDYKQKNFASRFSAGQILAGRLKEYQDKSNVLIVGLGKGGVETALPIVSALNVPLQIMAVKKLCLDCNRDRAYGAVAPGEVVMIDQTLVACMNIAEEDVKKMSKEALETITTDMTFYNTEIKQSSQDTVIIVDDGMITGMTMNAAIISIKMLMRPKKIIVATPIASRDMVEDIARLVDSVVVLSQPAYVATLADWYTDFTPVSREKLKEVVMQKERHI